MPIWFNMNKFTFDVVKSDCAVCLSSGAQDRCWKAFFQRYWINLNLKLQLVPFKKKQFRLKVLKVFWNKNSFYLPFHVHLFSFNLSSALRVKLVFLCHGTVVELYFASLRIHAECGKIRTRSNSVFGHFSHIGILQFYIYVHVHIHVKTIFKKA